MSALHITEIRERYNNGHYTYKDPIGRDKMKLPENYIFDENLSVKRNRELVIEHNQQVEHWKKHAREKQAELSKQLTSDVVEYIKEYYELTEKQAAIVENFVYREHHSYMCDYFSYIDTFADFADDLINWAE